MNTFSLGQGYLWEREREGVAYDREQDIGLQLQPSPCSPLVLSSC
jgi:hypothetical protein